MWKRLNILHRLRLQLCKYCTHLFVVLFDRNISFVIVEKYSVINLRFQGQNNLFPSLAFQIDVQFAFLINKSISTHDLIELTISK